MDALQPVKQLLSDTKLDAFVQTGQLVTLSNTATVSEALKLLADQKIMSVPVVDKDKEYIGCLSVPDVLKWLVKCCASTLLNEEWMAENSDVVDHELQHVWDKFSEEFVGQVLHAGDVWFRGDSTCNLLDVVVEGFRVHDAQAHHRVVVCENTNTQPSIVQDRISVLNIAPGTASVAASGLRPVGVVTQGDVLRHVHANAAVLGALKDAPVEELELCMGAVFTVPAATSALDAFGMMARDHKSSLGVTDANGRLLGNISVSDLRTISGSNWRLLTLPIGCFILARNGKSFEGLGADADWSAVLRDNPVKAVTSSSTLPAVLDMLISNGWHRVYVCDADLHPVHIITLTDILRLLTK